MELYPTISCVSLNLRYEEMQSNFMPISQCRKCTDTSVSQECVQWRKKQDKLRNATLADLKQDEDHRKLQEKVERLTVQLRTTQEELKKEKKKGKELSLKHSKQITGYNVGIGVCVAVIVILIVVLITCLCKKRYILHMYQNL